MTARVRAVTVLAISIASILISNTASAQSLPAGWGVLNIGAPKLLGSVAVAACTSDCMRLGVAAAGTDIWSTRDQFVFLYFPLTGNGSVVARVDALLRTDPWAKAGVMIRGSLSDSSAHGFALLSAANGFAFARRPQNGAATVQNPGRAGAAPGWVRLDREASTLTAYESADGVAWTRIGSDTIALPTTVYVGVAATSHNESLYTAAILSNVRVSAGPATPSLPSGWTSRDVGAPAHAGVATYANGAFALSGAGTDIWGTADQFQFAFRTVSGDVDVIARVKSLSAEDSWTKAGVMIRESLDPGAAHAHVFLSGRHGTAYQRRLAFGATTLHTDAGWAEAPAWLKLERRGVVVSAFTSRDGVTWTAAGTDLFDLPPTFYVGLALTSHNPDQAAMAVFDSVVIREVAASVTSPTGQVQSPTPTTSTSTSISTSTSVPAPEPTAVVRQLAFTPSSDHYTNVDGYVFDVALAATPGVVLLRQQLGKPAIVNGECAVDVSAVIGLLPTGSYVATVRAFNTYGTSDGASAAFLR